MDKGILNLGIVGTGSRSSGFIPIISSSGEAKISALCDPNSVRMEAFAARINNRTTRHSTIEEMLAKEKLDGVIITSPDNCHESNAVAAIQLGANVLIDKPLSTTVEGCRSIIAAARKARKIAMMGFNLRHDPTLRRLKQIIDQGVLGRVFLIENREFYRGGRTYMSRWNRKYALSGGLWIHKGSHDFDIFNWLLGFPRPLKVSSFAAMSVFTPKNIPFKVKRGTPVGPTCHQCSYKNVCPDVHLYDLKGEGFSDDAVRIDKYRKDLCMYLSDKDVHDNGIAMVEYENGARASHMECFVTSLSDRLYTVVGDRAMAEVSLARRSILIRPRWSDETIFHQIPELQGGHGGADPSLIASFIRALKGELDVTSTLEHGMLSTAIGQAAEISRREERTVRLDELLGSGDRIGRRSNSRS